MFEEILTFRRDAEAQVPVKQVEMNWLKCREATGRSTYEKHFCLVAENMFPDQQADWSALEKRGMGDLGKGKNIVV